MWADEECIINDFDLISGYNYNDGDYVLLIVLRNFIYTPHPSISVYYLVEFLVDVRFWPKLTSFHVITCRLRHFMTGGSTKFVVFSLVTLQWLVSVSVSIHCGNFPPLRFKRISVLKVIAEWNMIHRGIETTNKTVTNNSTNVTNVEQMEQATCIPATCTIQTRLYIWFVPFVRRLLCLCWRLWQFCL